MDQKTALITGASSGLGESFARFLSGRGLRVILTARREERLKSLCAEIISAGGSAIYFPADLSNEAGRAGLFEFVRGKEITPDILINNAGFGWYGYFYEMPWETASNLMAVNMAASAHLTRLFLPDMLARGSGHIINIGSIAGGLPNQGIAMYGASKAFLNAFTTALYRELRGSGVTASVMRLGPVETEFYDHARSLENGLSVPAEKAAIPVERVNQALWRLICRPKRFVYVPRWLVLSRYVENLFGGIIDLLGPLLLKRSREKR